MLERQHEWRKKIGLNVLLLAPLAGWLYPLISQVAEDVSRLGDGIV